MYPHAYIAKNGQCYMYVIKTVTLDYMFVGQC
jgi:hypothetical protein